MYPTISFGVYFQSQDQKINDKIQEVYWSGCIKFDVAVKGIGRNSGIENGFVGNIPTEKLINFMAMQNIDRKINLLHFESAWNKEKQIFLF